MPKNQITANKSVALNLISSFVSNAVTLGISFVLSPYIVKSVGVEAYGFVGLANNFISYASLITIALNALAGRFITIKIHEKDYEQANKYYSSVFIGNAFLSTIMLIIAIFIWVYLDSIINIPSNIYWDVKLLFAALFLNCIISTITSVFSVSTFATNKLYLGSVRSIESSVARAIILVILFTFLSPKVYYLGLTSLLMGIYCALYNMYYVRKLTPYLKIRRKYFNFSAIKELVFSGIWNLVTRLGQMLTDGLDLLITNLFIDATAMGVLSLAKTVPNIISSIVSSMVNSFSPNFTILYAEKKTEELKMAVKSSMRIMGLICNIPIIILIVCGDKFFSVWQPTQDSKQLQILSFLTCAGLIVNGGINCIYDIFTVVNKLRFNSIVLLISSCISVGITFLMLEYTDLGIYAVAGVSTVIMIIKNLVLIVPYAAKCIELKWYSFYPEVIRPIIFVFISVLICLFVDKYITITGWIGFFVSAIITGLISIFIGLFIVMKKDDRKLLISKIRKKCNI